MFEQIRFFHTDMIVDTSNNLGFDRETYQEWVNIYNMEMPDDIDYYIDGKTYFLTAHPLSAEKKKHLIYLQSFSYMQVGASYYTKRENYQSFLLLYDYKGKGRLTYEGKEYIIREGDGFLIDCRKKHYYCADGGSWEHADLHFFGGISEYICESIFESNKPVFHCSSPAEFQKKLETLLKIHTSSSANRDFFWSFELEKLLGFVLEMIQENMSEKKSPENVQLLRNYLENHFTKEISLDDMAEFSGISKYHLCRQFKKCIGFSPKDYVIHLRIMQAETLLVTTKMASYKIGILVGFPNEANFIRHFKRVHGMTPGEYRQRQ